MSNLSNNLKTLIEYIKERKEEEEKLGFNCAINGDWIIYNLDLIEKCDGLLNPAYLRATHTLGFLTPTGLQKNNEPPMFLVL